MSDDNEEFHPYVRLLLARMKSNPDEYHPEYESREMERTKAFLTDAERAALHAAEREILLGRYHQSLMEKILRSNEPQEYETSDGSKYRASQVHGVAGQVVATSTNGHTWTSAMDHDAYLAQQRAQAWGTLNSQQGYHQAAQSALMQNQLGGLAQSPQVYSGAITVPATTASALGIKPGLVPDNGSTTVSTWGGVVNKLLGR